MTEMGDLGQKCENYVRKSQNYVSRKCKKNMIFETLFNVLKQ